MRDSKQNKLRRSKTVSLDIPASIDNGITMRATGKGVETPKRGLVLVHIDVRPDPYFVRRGNDIHVEEPINLVQVSESNQVSVFYVSRSVFFHVFTHFRCICNKMQPFILIPHSYLF